MRVTRRAAVVASAFGLALAQAACAAPVEVSVPLWQARDVDLAILVDGASVCTLKGKQAAAGTPVEPTCRFDLAPSTRTLQVRGRYVTDDDGKRKAHAGEQAIALLDFAPVSKRLLDAQRSYGERVSAFIEAMRALAREHGIDVDIDAGPPATAAAVAAAEKRLGFALPPDLVSLQRRLGAIRIGDHSMTAVASLRDAYGAIVNDWGTPAAAMADDYSPAMQERLRASTLLFTEVGDGLGGLLYRPPPTKACGERGTYYWTSQESGEHDLSANGACPDFAGAFRWLLEGFVIADFADALDEEKGIVLIDSSAGAQKLRLEVSDATGFSVGLARQWDGAH